MDLLLKKDNKTIEFEDSSATLNVNDDLVHQVVVSVEMPLLQSEKLFVSFTDNIDSTVELPLNQSDGKYISLIPDIVFAKGGAWEFQIFRRRYASDTSFTTTSSYAYYLNVGDAVKTRNGTLVTVTMLQTLWDEAEAAKVRAESAKISAEDAKTLAQVAQSETMHYSSLAAEYTALAKTASANAQKAAEDALSASENVEGFQQAVKDATNAAESAKSSKEIAIAYADAAMAHQQQAGYWKDQAEIAKNEAVSAKQSAILYAEVVEGKAETVEDRYNAIMLTTNNLAKTLSFKDYLSAVNYFNTTDKEYSVGQPFYIIKKDVPDLWVSEVSDTSIEYTYSTDEKFIEDLRDREKLQVGKYFLSEQEGKTVIEGHGGNLIDGLGVGAIQQVADGVAKGFDFTGKNPNATSIDPSLTGMIPYGATGDYSSAFGGKSSAQGKRSHAEGTTTIAKGNYSHAEGDNSVAIGNDSHAEGYTTTSAGTASHAEGYSSVAKGRVSHAEGQETTASGEISHAEGFKTTASGNISHAEGNNTNAKGLYSHAEGSWTNAEGDMSHAEGSNTLAKGTASHAGGNVSNAGGNNSFAHGDHVKVYYENQAVFGQYNEPKTDTIFEIGNGKSENERNNAFEVYKDGTVNVSGKKLEVNGGKLYSHNIKGLFKESWIYQDRDGAVADFRTVLSKGTPFTSLNELIEYLTAKGATSPDKSIMATGEVYVTADAVGDSLIHSIQGIFVKDNAVQVMVNMDDLMWLGLYGCLTNLIRANCTEV